MFGTATAPAFADGVAVLFSGIPHKKTGSARGAEPVYLTQSNLCFYLP